MRQQLEQSQGLIVDVPPAIGAGFWGFMFGHEPWTVNTRTSVIGASPANTPIGFLFYVPRYITISFVTVSIETGIAASIGDVGIWDLNLNRVCAVGGFSTAVGGAANVTRLALTATTTLAPGWYYFVQTNTITTVLMSAWDMNVTNDYVALVNGHSGAPGNGAFVIGSTLATAGVLPANLGSLTNQNIAGAQVNPILAWFGN
jgi:hypothetical protein